MATLEIEERLSRLEVEVERLKAQAAPELATPLPWWEQISGVFKDCPAFDEAMRLGREWRESQRMEYHDDDTETEESRHDSA